MANNDDLTPEERVKDQRKALTDRRRKRNASDLREVVSTPEGRRFVMRVLEEGKAFNTCFDQNPIQMAFKEGKRDIALFLLGDLLKDHQTQYLQMCREARTLKQNDELELKSILEGEDNA